MSGIVGGMNLRSSGLVNLGSAADGQVFTGTGAGLPVGFEAAAGGGKLLQCVASELPTTVSATTSSFIDITGVTVDIDPTESDSNFLIKVTGSTGTSHGDNGLFKLVRLVEGTSATDVHVGDARSDRSRVFYGFGEILSAWSMPVITEFLDEDPAYTVGETLTYKVQWKGVATSRYNVWNRTSTDSDTTNYPTSSSSIVVMEIAT